MKLKARIVLTMVVLSVQLQAQWVEYKKLRERVEALATKGLPDEKINIIVNGISQPIQDNWAILLMEVQDYIDFRAKDEALNTIDMVTTFQNLITVKDELMKAVREKNMSSQGHAEQMYAAAIAMVKDKLEKIKQIPVLGLGKEYDIWYLLDRFAIFLDNFKKRILSDLAKLKKPLI